MDRFDRSVGTLAEEKWTPKLAYDEDAARAIQVFASRLSLSLVTMK